MKIGTQIKVIQKEKGTTRGKLARGLCSPQTLSNLEDNMSMADKALTDILLQRLGKSPDKLEVILPYEEYKKEYTRDLIGEAVLKGEREEAERLLACYCGYYTKPGRVQEMYKCRYRAQFAYRFDKDVKTAKAWIVKALDITLPGWYENALERYMISSVEMENLLAYGLFLLEQEKAGEEEVEKERFSARQHLERCQAYIDAYITDEEEHAKIACKCAWLLAPAYCGDGESAHAFSLCDGAFRELQAHAISYFMLPLLRIMAACQIEEGQEERKRQLALYQDVLERLTAQYGQSWCGGDSLFHNCYKKFYHLDYEFIRGERLSKGYTQEEVIVGIYEHPESLSRIENHRVSPNMRMFGKLMERLNVQKDRYNGLVVADSFKALEKEREITALLSRRKYKEAEQKIAELKPMLDLTIEENARHIRYLESVTAYNLKTVSYEAMLKETLALLESSYRVSDAHVYRAPLKNEVSLIVHATNLLTSLDRKDEEKRLLKLALDAMERGDVDNKYRYCSYSIVRGNLARALDSTELAAECVRYTLSCGKLSGLPDDLLTIACVLIDDVENHGLCRRMISDVYLLYEMNVNEHDKELVRAYYKKKFKEDMP